MVFISHSGKDSWVAKQIAGHMTSIGVETFLDEADIPIGADFEDEILSFLNRADELVVLLTPWALESPYIWAELGAAWGRRIPIVVVLHGLTVEEIQSAPTIPVFLKKRDLIEINDIERYFEQLRKRAATP